MTEEMLSRAWERNGPWVARRYGLQKEELERLKRLSVVPLPSGEIWPTPKTVLGLMERLERLEAAAERRRDSSKGSKRSTKASQASEDEGV